jgi:hypothetical protein
MGQTPLFQQRLLGEKDGILWQSKECGEGRSNFSVCRRSYSDNHCFFHFWGLSMNSGTHRGGDPTYRYLRVLTLKRIYAEGLQHRTRRKEMKIGVKKRDNCIGSEVPSL